MAAPITPPLAINPIITIQPVAPNVTGRDVANAQPLLALLGDGSIIRGFVVNRDQKNNPIIRTSSGDFVVQSEGIFIKTGSEIAFRVDSSQPSLARIITIDDQTPEAYSAQNLRAGLAQDTIAEPQLAALSQSARTTGQSATSLPIVQAVVLQALTTGQTTNLPRNLIQLPPGTPLNVTVFDVQLPPVPVSVSTLPQAPNLTNLLPNTAPAPQPQNAVPSSVAGPLAAAFLAFDKAQNLAPAPLAQTAIPPQAAASASPQTPQPPLPGAPQLQLQSQPVPAQPTPPAESQAAPQGVALPLTPSPQPQQAAITSPTNQTPGSTATPLPTQPASQPATPATTPSPSQLTLPANAPQAFVATVLGHGEDGSNIVHTPFASIKIFTPQPLPTGTNLTLAAEVTTNPAATQITPSLIPQVPLPNTNATAAPNFDYITAMLNQLADSDPTLARDVMQQLPVMGPRFTSGLLFFLSAVKTGDRRALSALEMAKPNGIAQTLLTQLSKDVRELHQNFTNPPFDDWKPIPLPLLFGNHTETAKLYIRREPDESGAKVEKASGGQRFLLDLSLSQLGPLQLDGFVRQSQSGKALELFLRSDQPLDSQISQDIRTLFTNALETTKMTGNIVFQQGAEHFVKPQPKPFIPPTSAEKHTILA